MNSDFTVIENSFRYKLGLSNDNKFQFKDTVPLDERKRMCE
jgi:hypothetical protein